jgi:hypothetical protein
VPADDSTQEEHGCITFYGFVDKQRFKYNAFHSRWIVLRGFNLYWYRSPHDKQQKGTITLPSMQVRVAKVGSTPCFLIAKEQNSASSRALKFKDDLTGVNREFKNKVANMIAYKQYQEACGKKGQRLDPQVVDFLCESGRGALEVRDKYMNEEHKVRTVLGEAMAQNHPRLSRLVLANCGLTDDSIDCII